MPPLLSDGNHLREGDANQWGGWLKIIPKGREYADAAAGGDGGGNDGEDGARGGRDARRSTTCTS
eukprot:760714-Hanusia_phi.AAC.5